MIGAYEQPDATAVDIHDADSWRDIGAGGTFGGRAGVSKQGAANVDLEGGVDLGGLAGGSRDDGDGLLVDSPAKVSDNSAPQSPVPLVAHPVAHPVAHDNVPLVAQPVAQPKNIIRARLESPPKRARATRKNGKNLVAHSVAQGPVPPDVPLVAHDACATSGTQPATPRKPKGYGKRRDKCATPKNMPGHEWRNLDSGWALFSRTPTLSESGKRSSTRKYLRWYTQAAIERIYGNAK